MYSKKKSRWIKHLDFIFIDIFAIVLSLMLAYCIRHGVNSVFARTEYEKIGLLMIAMDMVIVFFRNSYKDVIRRGYLKELTASVAHFSFIMAGLLIYLFLTKQSELFSRITVTMTWGFGCFFMYIFRISLKTWIRKRMLQKQSLVSVLVAASSDLAEETVHELQKRKYRDFQVTGVILLDKKAPDLKEVCGIPVVAHWENYGEYIKEHVVDELFVNVSGNFRVAEKLIDACVRMGITVHQNLMGITKGAGNKVVDEFAGYMVLTSSIKVAEYRDLFLKRCMDIAGGLIGILLTMCIFPFVAIAIKIKDNGPVLFSQERIGKNGRRFKIYKFRSMYMDAEERKKDLKEQNEMQGLMFKMKNDPRILPGVGAFIRKTSIDEFPQFWNVLKGDMSLVGTRPPTVEEYEQYDMHHLIRMSIKPGLTGLWQVSGRNRITDFEEIVKLDTRYIEEWNLNLDIKILLKTVSVVLHGNGE